MTTRPSDSTAYLDEVHLGKSVHDTRYRAEREVELSTEPFHSLAY